LKELAILSLHFFLNKQSTKDKTFFLSQYLPIVAVFAYQVLALWLLQCEVKDRPQIFNSIKSSLITQVQQNKCLIAEANLDLLSRFIFFRIFRQSSNFLLLIEMFLSPSSYNNLSFLGMHLPTVKRFPLLKTMMTTANLICLEVAKLKFGFR
jgi:hypothetical protein